MLAISKTHGYKPVTIPDATTFMLKSLEQAGFAAATADLNGILRSSNGGFAELLGWNNADLSGIAIGDLFHPDDSDTVGKWMKPVIARHARVSKLEHRMLNKNGQVSLMRLTVSEHSTGGAPGLLILLENIYFRASR